MRKKFVQTLAARQLEFGGHVRTNEAEFEKQTAHTDGQQDGAGEEIIEILDDDQEIELMMERHRKYHPRKYVNLQHPTSKIYYDKIDKVTSPPADREDLEGEDEDERNQLVIEESGPKELNKNNSSTTASSSGGGGRRESSVVLPVSSLPRNEDDAILQPDYQYRHPYGFSANIHLSAVPARSIRELPQHHQQRLKKTCQRSPDIPGPLMGPSHQHLPHPALYERPHPPERYVSYDRSATAASSSYYHRTEERQISAPSDARGLAGTENGTFATPLARKDVPTGEKRKSAFSPPRDRRQTMTQDADKMSAPPFLASPAAIAEASAVVAPRTPFYYHHHQLHMQHAYHGATETDHRTGIGGPNSSSYLSLEEWYRNGIPPPHMLTSNDLQSMYYYHYYLNKMAASSAYQHPYRDHHMPAVGAMPGIGAMAVPGMGAGIIVAASYPPPQYGFAKGGDQPALYGAQQPFDYSVYHSVLARASYPSASSCQPHASITTLASAVPPSSAPSSASEIIRPTVINRAPMQTAAPAPANEKAPSPTIVPKMVPINLVRPRMSPAQQERDDQFGSGSLPPTESRNELEPPGRSRSIPATIQNDVVRIGEGLDVDGGGGVGGGGGDRGWGNVAAVASHASTENQQSESLTPINFSAPSKSAPKASTTIGDGGAVRTTATATLTSTPPSTGRNGAKLAAGKPRGRPRAARNKYPPAAAPPPLVTAKPSAVGSATGPTADSAASSGGTPAVTAETSKPSSQKTVHGHARVHLMRKEIHRFLERRRSDIIASMRLYTIGQTDLSGLLQAMKRHSVIYRDFLHVAFGLMRKCGLNGFAWEPPAELDYRWKSPPQDFADYFAQNEQCSKTFVGENFDFLVLIVDNLLQQYIEPLEYFLLSYVLGLRAK